jgi:hypothetical protein
VCLQSGRVARGDHHQSVDRMVQPKPASSAVHSVGGRQADRERLPVRTIDLPQADPRAWADTRPEGEFGEVPDDDRLMDNADVGDVLRAMTNAERAQFVVDSLARATGAICGLNRIRGSVCLVWDARCIEREGDSRLSSLDDVRAGCPSGTLVPPCATMGRPLMGERVGP